MLFDCHIHPAIRPETDFGRYLPAGAFGDQVAALRRAGIGRACGSILPRTPPTGFAGLARLNDAALRLRDAAPEFYVPGVHVHPAWPDASVRELRRLRAAGVRWVGELVAWKMWGNEDYAAPAALAIMQAAAELDMVVNFHCGDLAAADALAAAVPSLPLVLAHPGDGESLAQLLALCARHANLHLDISGTGIDRLGMLRRACDLLGPHKLLFGSDYPINNPAVYVHGAAYEPLTAVEREALLHGNAERLLGEAARPSGPPPAP